MDKRKKIHTWLKRNSQETGRKFETDAIDRSKEEVPYRVDYLIFIPSKNNPDKKDCYIIGWYGHYSSADGQEFFTGKLHVKLGVIIPLIKDGFISQDESEKLKELLELEIDEETGEKKYKTIY